MTRTAVLALLVIAALIGGCGPAAIMATPTPSPAAASASALAPSTPGPTSSSPSPSASTVPLPSSPATAPPASSIGKDPITPTTCLPEPVTVAKILALRPKARLACFGSTEITFRAWVVDPGEGYGGICDDVVPAWIFECILADWLLAPSRTGNLDPRLLHMLHAQEHPHATGDLRGVSRWVTVTGHFDDPAAALCHLRGGPSGADAPPVSWYVLGCRETFVVTRIKTTR